MKRYLVFEPTGRILIDGYDILTQLGSPTTRQIGIVPQNSLLLKAPLEIILLLHLTPLTKILFQLPKLPVHMILLWNPKLWH